MTAKRAIPTTKYRDAHAAVEWSCRVLGFENRLTVEADNGEIAHAQLTLSDVMAMPSIGSDNQFGRLQRSAESLGVVSQSRSIAIDGVDDLYTHSVEAGAEIVVEICDADYSSRLNSCRDAQGQLWNFGPYNKWTD